NDKMAKSTVWLLGIGAAVLLAILLTVGSYNSLVSLDQGVQAQWAQVENVYQRRADLVPNLVQTVKGAASFEKETLTADTAARAFNTKRNSFPTVILAGFFGDRFREKPYFQAEAGAQAAPKVSF